MAVCLVCHGAGEHDFRDMDAFLEEHLTDEQLAVAKDLSGAYWGRILPCPECEGTGVISQERYDDLWAAAVAAVDQVRARWEAEQGGTA